MKAEDFATRKHSTQTRRDGTPYIEHPRSVAKGVEKYKGTSKNIDTLTQAAYLHDTLEDTETTYEELVKEFGVDVANIVMELTSDKERINREGKTSYLQTKMETMSSYALVIKLVDRLHNLSDLKTAQNVDWAIKYALQTYDIVNYLIKNRYLSHTHKSVIEDIQNSLLDFMSTILRNK